MEKTTRKEFEHVYLHDMQIAVSEARKTILQGAIIEEKGVKYVPFDYSVTREKTDIITVIYYTEFKIEEDGSDNNKV